MKLVITKDYKAMSELASHIVLSEMFVDKRVNVAITAGRTPKLMYEQIIPVIKGNPSLKNVHYYMFDETPITHRIGDNRQQLNDLFFTPALIPSVQIHPLDEHNDDDYEAQIEAAGGLDLMVIGMGADGHFCANMPPKADFDQYMYRINIDESFPWQKRYQDSVLPEQSTYMITMGAKSLMKVKRLVLIVNGSEKAEALKAAILGPVTTLLPASILRYHPNLTVIVDEEAAALLDRQEIQKFL